MPAKSDVEDCLKRSQNFAGNAVDLLENAPAGSLNDAIGYVLESMRLLRVTIREQQKQIEALQSALPAPSAAGQAGER